jgi:hypothetical protein
MLRARPRWPSGLLQLTLAAFSPILPPFRAQHKFRLRLPNIPLPTGDSITELWPAARLPQDVSGSSEKSDLGSLVESDRAGPTGGTDPSPELR